MSLDTNMWSMMLSIVRPRFLSLKVYSLSSWTRVKIHPMTAGEAREAGEARAAAERHCQEAADRAAARQATQEKALGELRRQLGEKDAEWVKRLSEAEGQLGEARAKGEVLAATAHLGEHPRVYEGSYAAPAARRPVRPERTAVLWAGWPAGRWGM